MWMTPKLSGRMRADERRGHVGDGVDVLVNSGDWIRITFSIGIADTGTLAAALGRVAIVVYIK